MFGEELDRQLMELTEADRFSGVVCVSQGADLLFHRAYGYSNRADRVPNETGTRFGTASLTKTFTATAVGLLADEGKLSFHAPVHEYLDFLPEHLSREVTVHHLLTHTSGIGDYFDEDALGSAAYEQVWEDVPMYRIRTPADLLPLFLDRPAVFAPGAGCRYNEAGYILLGLVIEALSGQAYADFVTERVFKVADMGGSGFFARFLSTCGIEEVEAMNSVNGPRPLALVTGASRRKGIGAAIALGLARGGWDVATTFWRAYEETMPWGSDPADAGWLREQLVACGVKTAAVEADLSLVETPPSLFDAVEQAIGPVTALVLSHCQSVDSDILGTTVASFDRHFAVNARASWLLVREFGQRFRGQRSARGGRGRIVALTSDAVIDNLPYGASKGALDRIVQAAAWEFRDLGITANVVNPGATDTGWMTAGQMAEFAQHISGGRVGLPADCAHLVSFLCSAEGGWINGQLLHSNGGAR